MSTRFINRTSSFRKARDVCTHSRAVLPWLPLNEKGDCLLPKCEDTDVTQNAYDTLVQKHEEHLSTCNEADT